MRNRVSAFRNRPAFSAVFVLLLAGMSGACSNSLRLQEPFFTNSTDNQRAVLGENPVGDGSYQPMETNVASNSVTRSDLPAPANAYANAESQYEYEPEPAEATPSGWSAVGGRVVTVARNEDPVQIRAGKVIVIPRRVAMSAGEPMPMSVPTYERVQPIEQPVMVADAETYVVQPGETLFGVARKVGMKASEIAALNGFTTDSQLKTGQTLRLRGDAATRMAETKTRPTLGAPEKPLGTLVVSGEQAKPEPKIKLQSPADTAATGRLAMDAPKVPEMPTIPAARVPSTETAAIDNAADAASTDGKAFRWPVRGRIISGFGSKPNGERNDGINLAVPEGTSVKSVETGTVIYAGNELEGYGNLVLVRHADGWVSAYAHNKEIMVKRGDEVRRGQTVATAGMTGSVSSPQVHFELRKGAKPVNPLDYLAGA
jgi:murein DD-endopeptidase MepM/ murein hydrolase activator NlpD